MSIDKKDKGSYMSDVIHFYFAPEFRSIGTILYLGVFSYFTLYFIDNVFLAIQFLIYTIINHTSLEGITYLFTSMAFIVSLFFPFFLSFYSIFVLYEIWRRPHWAIYIKWLMTIVISVAGVTLIVLSDEASRIAARQESIRSFVEDAGILGKI